MRVVARLRTRGVLVAASNAQAAKWAGDRPRAREDDVMSGSPRPDQQHGGGERSEHPKGAPATSENRRAAQVRGNLFGGEGLSVVNVGLAGFAGAIAAARAGTVTHLAWRPPASADATLARRLADLTADPFIDAANQQALAAFLAAEPVLVGVAPARDVIAGLGGGERRLLHAGPPIAWETMCGPMQGAIVGAILARTGPATRAPPSRWRHRGPSPSSPATATAPSVRWPA